MIEPRTRDGVLVKIGMTVYVWSGWADHEVSEGEIVKKLTWDEKDEEWEINYGDPLSNCYASKEVAERERLLQIEREEKRIRELKNTRMENS